VLNLFPLVPDSAFNASLNSKLLSFLFCIGNEDYALNLNTELMILESIQCISTN